MVCYGISGVVNYNSFCLLREIRDHSLFMLGVAGKIHQKTQQNVLALPRKTKKGMTPLNVLLKTG